MVVRIACIVLLLALAACERQRGPRLLVFGIDGLHLPLLDRLVEQDEMPNFAALYRQSLVGGVSTNEAGQPPISPRIWTSFVTGHLPGKHGIVGFFRTGPDGAKHLSGSNDRLVPAVWEIASALGIRVGVVNWLASYPAERVNGFVVSELYLPQPALVESRGVAVEDDRSRLVHPPELLVVLDRLPRPPLEMTWTPDAAEVLDRSVLEVSYAALDRHPVDLLMIYTRATDQIGHLSWFTHEPRPGETVEKDLVVEYYRRLDRLLGELLGHVDADTQILVLSDHGMERNPTSRGLSGSHGPAVGTGVMILRSPLVRPGRGNIRLLDVTPTILALLHIPRGPDMFGVPAPSRFPIGTPRLLLPAKAPYARTTRDETPVATPAVERDVSEHLRALGYVE